MAFSFVPVSIAALAGVRNSEAGLASGLINTSEQIGGTLGIAAIGVVVAMTMIRREELESAPDFVAAPVLV